MIKHSKTDKHKSSIQDVSTSKNLDSFFIKQFSSLDVNIRAAEAAMVHHTVIHHQSFKSMDCTSSLVGIIFNDSNIAKNFASARTKTAAIITGVLSPYSVELLFRDLQKVSFVGMGIDSGNHGNMKMIPITVQYYDYRQGGIQIRLLDLLQTEDQKARTVTDSLTHVIKKSELEEKLSSFCADNTNTNFGGINRREGNNVFTLLKETNNDQTIGIGCPTHIVHNNAHHG